MTSDTHAHNAGSQSADATRGDDAEADQKALVLAEQREHTVRSKFWTKFKAVARNVPFSRDLLAAYYCALDTATPFRVRATLLGALVYFITPIDMLPDFIMGLGFTDDAAVLYAAIRAVAGSVKPEHYQKADDNLQDNENPEPGD
ncbi:MAG: YkvA family protein [Pseudomonadota bacterium]